MTPERSQLRAELLADLARYCRREAARPTRTREGRELALAYEDVARSLDELRRAFLTPEPCEVRP